MKNFIKNLDKKICKIIFSDSYGTGFFCRIPYPDKNYLTKVLITKNHVLNKDYLEKSNIISIEIDKETKEINLNVKRNIWTDKILDQTIIEILAKDKFDDFLLVDENILDKNLEHKKYLNSSIILPAYMENQQIFFNQRNMTTIPDNNGRFLHNCNTIPGASGGPIILVDDFSVIGIHKGYDTENKKNVGVLLRNITLDIQNKQPLNLKKDKPLVNIDNKENNNIIIDDKDVDKNDNQNN